MYLISFLVLKINKKSGGLFWGFRVKLSYSSHKQSHMSVSYGVVSPNKCHKKAQNEKNKMVNLQDTRSK